MCESSASSGRCAAIYGRFILLFHRFDLETSERKYQFLTWGDCEYMALQLMSQWVTRPILLQHSNPLQQNQGVLAQRRDRGLVHADTIFGNLQRIGSDSAAFSSPDSDPSSMATASGSSGRRSTHKMKGGGSKSPSVAGIDESPSKFKESAHSGIRRKSKSMGEEQLSAMVDQAPDSADVKPALRINRLHSNWNTFGAISNANPRNVSMDASGAQFALTAGARWIWILAGFRLTAHQVSDSGPCFGP